MTVFLDPNAGGFFSFHPAQKSPSTDTEALSFSSLIPSTTLFDHLSPILNPTAAPSSPSLKIFQDTFPSPEEISVCTSPQDAPSFCSLDLRSANENELPLSPSADSFIHPFGTPCSSTDRKVHSLFQEEIQEEETRNSSLVPPDITPESPLQPEHNEQITDSTAPLSPTPSYGKNPPPLKKRTRTTRKPPEQVNKKPQFSMNSFSSTEKTLIKTTLLKVMGNLNAPTRQTLRSQKLWTKAAKQVHKILSPHKIEFIPPRHLGKFLTSREEIVQSQIEITEKIRDLFTKVSHLTWESFQQNFSTDIKTSYQKLQLSEPTIRRIISRAFQTVLTSQNST